MERELVRSCLAGEPGGWEAFLERYGPLLRREVLFAMRRYRAPDDPALLDDLLQEVFQALLENDRAALRRFRWDSSLETYLKLVAFRRTLNGLRRRPSSRLPEQVLLDAARERLAAEKVAPADRLAAREELEAALRRLPARERLALQLHYWSGVSPDRLAALFSIRNDSVRALLSRARRRLRDLLGGGASICL